METSRSKFFSGDNLRMAIFLVTLLTAVWGIVWSLNTSLESRMIARFDKVDKRFDKIDERLDKIDERLDSFGERIARNEGTIDALGSSK